MGSFRGLCGVWLGGHEASHGFSCRRMQTTGLKGKHRCMGLVGRGRFRLRGQLHAAKKMCSRDILLGFYAS
ncbi:unnamed protein product [Musa banksii]